jgi:hypothetical protein
MNDNKLGVALAKEVCPACCKEMDGPIIMNTRLNESQAKKVEEMNGKVIGFSDKFCDECEKHSKMGVILITVDAEKTEDRTNPWRTGGYFVIKDDAIERIFPEEQAKELIKKRMGYIEHKAAEAIGLFNHTQDGE